MAAPPPASPSGGAANSPSSSSSIRLLLLGDEQVGKSSLVSTFVSQIFPPSAPRIMTTVRIPPTDACPSLTTIIDSQGDELLLSLPPLPDPPHPPPPQSRPCDVIILVYDATRPATFQRLATHWLPLIEQSCPVPTMLVSSKIDLSPPSASSSRDQSRAVMPLLSRFKFLHLCMESSAKTLLAVSELFFMAQTLVLYPIDPLFDIGGNSLRPGCARALARIFRVFDKDNDGLLSDAELNAFQL